MHLTLQQLMPLTLRHSPALLQNGSGIWGHTLTFQQGDYIFIKAPSGTGKTTLIHILYALRHDYEGTVHWGNTNPATITPEQLATIRSNNISIVFQDMRLLPQLTAYENLEIKRQLTHTIPQQQVQEWMARLGMAHKKDALANTLSLGEQQRVSIIRALLQPFQWLLLDEPFSHLDTDNAHKAATLIGEVVAANKASLLLADLHSNPYFPYTQTLLL
jgi:putative ABC transport system ATP-binding protein